MSSNDIVRKLRNLCDVLSNDGINYSDYVAELVLVWIWKKSSCTNLPLPLRPIHKALKRISSSG